MSRPLIIRCRLRAFILERCKHWHIKRQRIPREVIDTIATDLTKQVDVRICSMLTKPDPVPATRKPRKAKVYKRAMSNQPSLF